MTTPTAADYLRFHCRHFAEGDTIEIRTFDASGKPGPRAWHDSPEAAAEYAASLPQHLNKFYGINARTRGGGKKEHISAIGCAHADLDFERYANGEAGAWAALDAFPLRPTFVIASGGGLQPIWELVEPLANREQFPAFEAMLSRLAERLNGDPAVAESARVLRLPGSLNNKAKYGTPRPVTIARCDLGALYTADDFARELPPPAREERPRAEYPRDDRRDGDIPTISELGEMLRHINPQPGYHKWFSIIAGVHSVYPGADGEALCEAWSGHVSKAGEIADKFKSLGNYKGQKGNATIATVIYEAKQGGYRPPQATYHQSHRDREGYVAHDGDRLATLEEDVRRLGEALREAQAENARLLDRLRHSDEEGARLVLRVTALETENAALEAAIKHPNQAAGVGSLDLIEEANRAYGSGAVLTVDGKDYARVPFTKAANRRAAKTLSRGFEALCEAGTIDAFTRPEQIETATFKGNVEIAYIHIPPDLHGQRGKAVLSILPTPTEPKKHGGRRTIEVPKEVAAQEHPVRRKREHITRWHDALTDQPITVEMAHLGTDYWTAQGEQLLPEEIERQRVALGYEPPRAPAYRPGVQQPLRIYRHTPPRQDADIEKILKGRQDAEGYDSLFEPTPPGRCADPECGDQAEIGNYCARHFNEHARRHRATYAYPHQQAGD